MLAWFAGSNYGLGILTMGSTTLRADRHKPILPVPILNEESLYVQNWFSNSTLDIRQDLENTEREGKRLVIFWEQKNCIYCSSMHEINLRIPRIVRKITENFRVIRLNIWGEREIIGLDGKVLLEQEFARKNNITLTPTVQFLGETGEEAGNGSIIDSEAFRFEGYFKPFHYYFLFHYVVSKGYATEPNFQRWLGEIGSVLQEDKIKYDLWADVLPEGLPDLY
jgi:thioredoxin-related protein